MTTYDHQHAFFEARIWIDQESVKVETWAFELIPTDGKNCGTAEWAARHLEECSREDLLTRFELDPSRCWQMIFQGSMHGWFHGYSDEYDEEFRVMAFQASEVPPNHFEPYLGEDFTITVKRWCQDHADRIYAAYLVPYYSAASIVYLVAKDGYEITTDDTIELEDLLLGNCDICVSVCKNLVDIEPLVKETLYP